jgi:hypothetical protein
LTTFIDPEPDGVIGALRLQCCSKVLRSVFVADELHRLLDRLGCRSKKPVSDQSWQRVRDADSQPCRSPARTAFQHICHFLTERENLVRVPVHNMAEVGKDKIAARASEQLFSERLFERADLAADRGLREQK